MGESGDVGEQFQAQTLERMEMPRQPTLTFPSASDGSRQSFLYRCFPRAPCLHQCNSEWSSILLFNLSDQWYSLVPHD